MGYKVDNEEKQFLQDFKKLRVPATFKNEHINYMLFVEEVDFTACEILLKGTEITKDVYDWLVTGRNNGHCLCYDDFISGIDKFYIDEYTREYCEKIMRVMLIFSKYYNKR